jgi:hypothetical protein
VHVILCSAHPTYYGRIIDNQIGRIDISFSPPARVQSIHLAGAAEVTTLNFKFAVTFQSYDCSSMMLGCLRSNFALQPLGSASQVQHIQPWLTQKAAL